MGKTDAEAAARKAAKKEEKKKRKHSEVDDTTTASKKEKKDKKRKSLDGDVSMADMPEVSIVAHEDGDVEEDGDDDKKVVPKIVGALVPFANPLADEKVQRKVLKGVKKAAKSKSLKRGVKEVVKSVRKSPLATPSTLPTALPPGIVILAADISPMDVISHIPVLCEDHGIPYLYVPSRAELGAAGNTKRPTSVVMIGRNVGKGVKEEVGGEWEESYKELHKVALKLGQEVKV